MELRNRPADHQFSRGGGRQGGALGPLSKLARLGLAVADEQHRFGVLQREDLRKKGYDADVLVTGGLDRLWSATVDAGGDPKAALGKPMSWKRRTTSTSSASAGRRGL